MNKHRSYLSIHIYTFRYDCCGHCNWHLFLLFVDSQSELTDPPHLSSVSSRQETLHTVAY